MNNQKIFRASKEAIKNAFRKPDTRLFPILIKDPPKKYRGSPKLNQELCTLCLRCSRECPTGAIQIDKKSKERSTFEIDLGKCCYCGECEDACTFDAIVLSEEWLTAELDREKLIHHHEVTKTKNKIKDSPKEEI